MKLLSENNFMMSKWNLKFEIARTSLFYYCKNMLQRSTYMAIISQYIQMGLIQVYVTPLLLPPSLILVLIYSIKTYEAWW